MLKFRLMTFYSKMLIELSLQNFSLKAEALLDTQPVSFASSALFDRHQFHLGRLMNMTSLLSELPG